MRWPRGQPGTLAEAKQMAEEDHERRRAAALAKSDKAKLASTADGAARLPEDARHRPEDAQAKNMSTFEEE
jgi:hypothetical protein